jgi:hypothetical protein
MNPLRGFISHSHLFEDIDGKGINIRDDRGLQGLFAKMIDTLLGRIEVVTICGDSVAIDELSAEEFFSRNAKLLEGIIPEESSIKEKILKLLKEVGRKKSFPIGLLEERFTQKGKRLVIGTAERFRLLVEALERNGFILERMRKKIDIPADSFVHFEQEEFYQSIIEENKENLSQLRAAGWKEIRQLSQLLIERMKQESA